MARRTSKPTPVEAFELNVDDAHWLVATAQVLRNQRTRRMRRELRAKIGEALDVPQRDHDKLDCIESGDVFVVIKPTASITRAHVADLAPLLRQSVVAASAAFETYLADAVCARIGGQIRARGPL